MSKELQFDSKTDAKNTISFYKSLKCLVWVGRLTGVCPVQNSGPENSFMGMTNRKMSLAYLLSFISLILKGTASFQLLILLFVYKSTYVSKENETKLAAGTMGFCSMFCFGLFAHMMSVWRLTPFLKCLWSLETYDMNYPRTSLKMDKKWEKCHRIGFCTLMTSLFPCAVIVCTPIYILYEAVLPARSYYTLYLFPGISTDNKSLILAYFSISFLILEIGVGFVYEQVFWLVRHLSVRFEYMAQLIEEKAAASSPAQLTLLDLKPREQKTWRQLTKQYNDLVEAFNNFQEFSWPYYLILLSTLLVSSVCLLYVKISNYDNPMAMGEVVEPKTLDTILTIMAGRIWSLPNSGQILQDRYTRIRKAIMMASLTEEFIDEEEQEQLEALVDQITSSKLSLVTNGFFVVSKRNITSIVSVILTYLVVLFQFRTTTTDVDLTPGG